MGTAAPRLGPSRRAYLLAAACQLFLAAFFVHAWDGFVFQTTIRQFVEDGTTPYDVIGDDPTWIYNKADAATEGEWYAYPSLPLLLMAIPYAIANALGTPWMWAMRIAWKLPILVATLLLPRLGRKTALALGGSPLMAGRLESVLLWNPLLWIIGPMRGMTEPIMLAFLFASLTTYARRRFVLSGILWGLAASVKIFPWFVYPAFLLWILVHHHRDWRPALQHAVAAGTTFLALALPFLLQAPKGFLELTFLMHLRRPPAGFSVLVPLYDNLRHITNVETTLFIVTLVGLVGMTAFLLFTIGWLTGTRRGQHDELPIALGALLLGFVLLNKVVHWQYFLPPAVLLALAGAVPNHYPRNYERFYRRFFIAAGIGSLLDGFNLFRYVPLDVSQRVFGMSQDDVLEAFRHLLHSPTWLFNLLALPLAAVLTIWGFAPVARPIFHFYHDASVGFGKALHLLGGRFSQGHLPRPVLAVLVVVILLLPSGVALYLHSSEPEEPLIEPPPAGDRLLGAYYYLWWRNPSYDYEVRDGNWRFATTTPIPGYYSSTKGIIEESVRNMKATGIDFALIPIHEYDAGAPLETFVEASQDEQFRFTPLFQLQERPRWDERTVGEASPPRQPLTRDTINDWEGLIDDLPAIAYASPNLLRVDGRPVVFLEGARYLGDPNDADEFDAVLARVIDDHTNAQLTWAVGNDTWLDEPQRLGPPLFNAAAHPQVLRSYWTDAYAALHKDAWTEILDDLLDDVPDIAFVLADSDVGTPGFPHDRVVATFSPWDEIRPGAAPPPTTPLDVPQFNTLYPSYNCNVLRAEDPIVAPSQPADAGLAENWTRNADAPFLLLHSWNEHQEGTAIEPTREAGAALLGATIRLAAAWREADASLN